MPQPGFFDLDERFAKLGQGKRLCELLHCPQHPVLAVVTSIQLLGIPSAPRVG